MNETLELGSIWVYRSEQYGFPHSVRITGDPLPSAAEGDIYQVRATLANGDEYQSWRSLSVLKERYRLAAAD